MFKAGDIVMCIRSADYNITEGNLYKILEYIPSTREAFCSIKDDRGRTVSLWARRFISNTCLTLEGTVILLTTKVCKIGDQICKLTNGITVLQNEYVELTGYIQNKIFVVYKKKEAYAVYNIK